MRKQNGAIEKPTKVTYFTAHGPFEVPIRNAKKSKVLAIKHLEEFWSKDREFSSLSKRERELRSLSEMRGCYVFAIKASKGYTPWYIGKTKRSFSRECFDNDKLVYYMDAMADKNGTPVMFFLAVKKPGPLHRVIGRVENHFIQTGFLRNPDLKNKRGKAEQIWGIKGVIQGGQGNHGKGALEFKKLFGLN